MVSLQSDMQHNMHNQEDLIALFSRNLTFDPEQQAALLQEQLQQAQAQAQAEAASQPASPPVVYSSQHYTHSYHVAKQPQNTEFDTPRSSSVPPENGSAAAELLLRSHGVDPSILTPSQLQLFRVAEAQQQMRLMELWSICPPSGAQNIPSLAWSSTTVEQEEQLARARYERSQMDHGNIVQDSEPYMTAGYEDIMRQGQDAYSSFGSAAGPNYQRAMDPVYLGPDYARQQQMMDMASQYGAFEQFRENGPADAMDVM